MNLLRRLDAWWLAPAPAERLATFRALCGAFAVVYLLVRAPVLADFRGFPAHDFAAVGAARLLSAPLSPGVAFALYLLTLASGIAFTLGTRFRITGPLFAGAFLLLTSYRNSWGMVFHTDNLLCVHLGVLGLSSAADARSLDARARSAAAGSDARYGWPLRLACALTVSAYALAGIAKLKISGGAWADGEILRNYIAYDALRKAQVGSVYSPLGGWLVQYAWPFPIIGALTLVLELGAPLALLHARLGKLWVAGIWAFHVGVLATMAIAFPYPLAGVAFAPFFRCERLRGSSGSAEGEKKIAT
jgi:hypothetical protein